MLPSRNNTTEEYISSLIQTRQENEFVDFKQFYYHDDKKYDLIRDIVSFSNESTSVEKYIVFGVINGTWEVEGINLSTIPDVSVINDLLHMYVEPFIYDLIYSLANNGKNSELMFLSDNALWPTEDELKEGQITINLRGEGNGE